MQRHRLRLQRVLPPSAYVGVYSNDYVGDAKVVDSGGWSLFLALGPTGKRFPLIYFNRDMFVYNPMAKAPKARIGMSFLVGPDGKPSEVTIEDLNEYKLGRLTRVIRNRSSNSRTGRRVSPSQTVVPQ